jgi:6-pyruvoyltetrahydropterin/6-carboxytetrahydropterin synthase
MIKLSREVRFALVPANRIPEGRPSNSWAGWPSTNLVAPHLTLRCVVAGNPDPQTGYLCDITVIDRMLRGIITRCLIPNFDGHQTAEEMIRIVHRETQTELESSVQLVSVSLDLSPFLSFTIEEKSQQADSEMNSTATHRIQLTQQFEFSAAHRLHCDGLSEDENRQMFGKCNNPSGHGHNYVFEVTVSNAVDSDRGQVIAIENLESTVKRLVVDRLDHKHLNLDVEYFAKVNPSVENISVAIYNWLDGQFGTARLERVKVFETPKTWAEFGGEK